MDEEDDRDPLDLSDITFEDGNTPEENPRDFARIFAAVAAMFEAHFAVEKARKGEAA